LGKKLPLPTIYANKTNKMNSTRKSKSLKSEVRSSTQNFKKLLLKKQVIDIFYKEGHKSIADLCEITTNSIPTMANLMNELTAEGWVTNFGIGVSKGGRKPSIYGLNPTAAYIAGIDLSRRYTRIRIFNLHNKPLGNSAEISEGLDTSENILSLLKNEVHSLLKKNKILNDQILGYGINIPGLIDLKKGISLSYTQFGTKPLAKVFRDLLGRPAFVEHDTKAMAVGEAWFGLARDKSDVLFVNIGSGIGLGMILNGELYQGNSGFSGEFGHIQMIPEGELCYCGKIGCLETIASGSALVKKATEKIKNGKNSIINNLVNKNTKEIKLHTIIDAANQGDQFAIELLEEAGEYLAKGLSVLIHLFNPEAIIIGGEMAEAGNLIIDPIQQKLNKYTMMRLKQDTMILLSELKEKAGLLGILPVVMTSAFSFDPDSRLIAK
jgi:N-acetylglucosamine repressor